MRNTLVFGCLSLAAVTAIAAAQQVIVSPQVRIKATADNKITEIELESHFVTTIRVPEPVNSVVVGDPVLFQVEHSEHQLSSSQSWRRIPRRLISCCDISHRADFW